jgi:hypothetical protein
VVGVLLPPELVPPELPLRLQPTATSASDNPPATTIARTRPTIPPEMTTNGTSKI